ncbi:MAG: rhomboid family intramembrane serine protease [Nitriliruptor sp.]|nr:MAG: rhomboid family intramembrane serine protease [Nitriliruptor sp.]
MSQDAADGGGTTDRPACYLHPGRPALLRCSRCEQPICGEDAIEAPVGYQCPRCAQGGQPVRRMVDVVQHAPVTRVLVGVIAVLFLVTSVVPAVTATFGLRPIVLTPSGVAVLASLAGWYQPSQLAQTIGEPWLLLTSGFLHANLMHVGFNGLLLWQLGHLLEPLLGRGRYVALYTAGLFGGSLGVVLVSWVSTLAGISGIELVGRILGGNPLQLTIGASGAVFGLMGAAMVVLRARGVNPWQTTIGTLVALNLVLTFLIPSISVGGHLGGLLAGVVAGRLLMVDREQAATRRNAVFGLALAMVVASLVLARLTVGAIIG